MKPIKSRIILLTVFTWIAAATVSQVQADYTWTGAVDDNWGTSGNWTFNGNDNGRWRVNSTTVGGIMVTDTQQPSPAATLFMQQNSGAEKITITPTGSLTLQNMAMVWGGNGTTDSTFIVDGGYLRSNNSLDMRLGNTEQGSFEVRNGGTASIAGRLYGTDNPPATANATVTVDGTGSTLTFGGNWEGYDNIDLTLSNGGSLSVRGAMTYEGTAFTVDSGSTLTLGSDGDAHVFSTGLTIASGGTLEPYQTLDGAANITGAVNFLSGSTYDYGVNPGDSGPGNELEDTVNVIGNLDLEAFTLDLAVFGSDYSRLTDEYTLFQFSTLTSSGGALTEAALNGLVTYTYPAGTQLLAANNPTLTIVGNTIVLSGFSAFAIPEPSSLALLLIGGVLLRRRLVRTKS